MSHQQYVQVPIGSLPVHLICLANGKVALVPVSAFPTIYDQGEDGSIVAVFTQEGFKIGGVDFSYRVEYNYKLIPELLSWLVAQHLTSPF
jgi:hypothetical protein